jgi:polar amino acid transport system substrate-binding protein
MEYGSNNGMMHFRNLILRVGAVAFLFATAQSHATCEPDKVSEKYPGYAGKAVVVAVTPMTPPFAFTNPDNLDEIIGLEVELMEGVMACAGLEIEWLIGKWSGILPTVFSGASDLMIGNVVYSEDRAEQGDFVVFIRNSQTVVARKGNPRSIVGLDSLCGLKAAQTIGAASALAMQAYSDKCVATGKPAIDILMAENQESAFRQLLVNRVDMVMEGAEGAARRIKSPTGQNNFEAVFSLTADAMAGAITRNDNDEMLQILADGMTAMKEDGRIDELFDKYQIDREQFSPIQILKK